MVPSPMGIVVSEAMDSPQSIPTYLSDNGFLLPGVDLAQVELVIQEALDEKERGNELVAKMQAKEKESDPHWMPVPCGYTLTHATPTPQFIAQRLTRFFSEKASRMEFGDRTGRTVVERVAEPKKWFQFWK